MGYPALSIRPVEVQNPLDVAARVQALRAGQQEMGLRDQQSQLTALQIQEQKMQLDSDRSLMSIWSKNSGNMEQTLTDAANSGQVRPESIMKLQQFNTDLKLNAAKATNEQLSATQKEHGLVADSIDSVRNLPVEQRAAAMPSIFKNLRDQGINVAPYVQMASQMPDASDTSIKNFETGLLGIKEVAEREVARRTEASKISEAGTTAQKGALEVQPPDQAQRDTFTQKTLQTFHSIPPERKQAYVSEANAARTVPELNAVIARADADDKAETMHQDSLAQTKALAGTKYVQQGLEANDKTWTDPQHGYVTTASQLNVVKQTLQAGADGNGLAASLGPTMTALGINGFNQMHRISPAEAASAGAPGGYAERFNAWATKAFTGKLSAQVASEGQSLMDELLTAAHDRSVQASQMHAKGYGIEPKNMPAMDIGGNVTTLDKVNVGQRPTAPAAEAIPTNVSKALSGASSGRHTLSDGSIWDKKTDGSIVKVKTP